MCLAVPGEIMSIEGDDALLRVAQVRFGGVWREVSLAFVPEARTGDRVLVHAGVAIATLDAQRAADVEATLAEILNAPPVAPRERP
jgi:hydrogenase expression/formation protein HypC